ILDVLLRYLIAITSPFTSLHGIPTVLPASKIPFISVTFGCMPLERIYSYSTGLSYTSEGVGLYRLSCGIVALIRSSMSLVEESTSHFSHRYSQHSPYVPFLL